MGFGIFGIPWLYSFLITCSCLYDFFSGDIALLLHAGMGIKRALILNMGAALCSFVGLAIGILLGQNTNANIWIFAIAGGMFIYIALVVMVRYITRPMGMHYNHYVRSSVVN